MEFLGHMEILLFSLRITTVLFLWWLHFFSFLSTVPKCSNFSMSSLTLFISVLLIVSILLGMWWYFILFFICISLMVSKWNIFSWACWPFLYLLWRNIYSRAFCCSFTQSNPNLCNPSTSGFLVLHSLPEFAQTLVHWVDDAIHPFHPLFPPCSHALKLSQHQGIFQWAGSLHQVAKGLKLQCQHQSFQRIFRVVVL